MHNIKTLVLSYRGRSTSEWLSYLRRGLKILFHLKGHLRLASTLAPLYSLGLISPKIGVIYLFDYLSLSMTTARKLAIISFHYSFFQEHLSVPILQRLYATGLLLWSGERDANTYEIILNSTTPYEEEGSLSMDLRMNGGSLYRMSFSVAPGNVFGLENKKVFYITRMQGAGRHLETIRECTKAFLENKPSALLVAVLEGMALALNISGIVGVSTENQLGCVKAVTSQNYNVFWETFESTRIATGDYLVAVPIPAKDISLLISKRRKRTLLKREVRREITEEVQRRFAALLQGYREEEQAEVNSAQRLKPSTARTFTGNLPEENW